MPNEKMIKTPEKMYIISSLDCLRSIYDMMTRYIKLMVFVCFFLQYSVLSYAGIPEPGMIFYGKVYNETGVLITSGTLEWTFAPSAGGTPVLVETQLEEIDVQGTVFSYRMQVPFESLPAGSPASGDAIPLSPMETEYQWTARVAGTTIEMSDVINISMDNRGTFLNMPIGDPVFVDSDGDGLDDAWEQAIVDADPFDNINSIYDVLPGDDYDGDGESNGTEFANGTDPTDAGSVFNSLNAYASFHFEIFRCATQIGTSSFNEDSWGAVMACSPRNGETFNSGALSKPSGSIGSNPVALILNPLSGDLESKEEFYVSFNNLISDYAAGEYRVDIIADNGGSEPYHLRFKITVPAYDANMFPDYLSIDDPKPGEIDVVLNPLLEFSAYTWDYFTIIGDMMEEVYFYMQKENEISSDFHQIPDQTLDYYSTYFLKVDTNDWGNTWLGSVTETMFHTIGQECQCDLDNDGVVDGLDLFFFIKAYNHSSGSIDYNPDADFNQDNTVDKIDLSILGDAFGKTGCMVP